MINRYQIVSANRDYTYWVSEQHLSILFKIFIKAKEVRIPEMEKLQNMYEMTNILKIVDGLMACAGPGRNEK